MTPSDEYLEDCIEAIKIALQKQYEEKPDNVPENEGAFAIYLAVAVTHVRLTIMEGNSKENMLNMLSELYDTQLARYNPDELVQ